MKQIVFIFFTFLVSLSTSVAQRIKFLSFEAGFDFIHCDNSDKSYIHKEKPNGVIDPIFITPEDASAYKIYTGAKIEVRSNNNKIGFVTGIRTAQIHGTFLNALGSSDYFTLSVDEAGVPAEFKIREINQTLNYLGVPVELRYLPFGVHLVNIYFKLGADFNFLVASKTKTVFFDDGVNANQNTVAQRIGNLGSFYSSVYGGAGIHIGRESKPGFNLELTVPSIFIQENHSLIRPVYSVGIQMGYQIPLRCLLNKP